VYNVLSLYLAHMMVLTSPLARMMVSIFHLDFVLGVFHDSVPVVIWTLVCEIFLQYLDVHSVLSFSLAPRTCKNVVYFIVCAMKAAAPAKATQHVRLLPMSMRVSA